MTLLEVESLTKRYRSIVAVDDLSFSVAPGETLGLLGPNGEGKTTTMGCVVGLLEPDGGRVNIDGLAPRSRQVNAMVGYAAQRTALYPSLRVSENLAFFGGLYGLRGRSLAMVRMNSAGSSDSACHSTRRLSHGMSASAAEAPLRSAL